MTTDQAISFSDPSILPWLGGCADAEFDQLEFGAIGIDAGGIVRRYNTYESNLAGLSVQRVVGKPLFTAVAPCMNNEMVAARFDAAAQTGVPLDLTMDYVLTLRMRPVKVQLRLLADPEAALRWVLVLRAV